MCKTLFPELHKKSYNKSLLFYEDKNYACGFYITGEGKIGCSYSFYSDNDSYHIHLFEQINWFEFCLTHLPSNLNIIHPVDYLYEQFKKR
jgi:hypothetical protein